MRENLNPQDVMFSEIIITVTDVDAALAFYTQACRFTHVRTVEHDGAAVAELDADGQRVTLVAGAQPGVRLVLDSTNPRADHRRLTRLGCDVGEQPRPVTGGTWIGFTDPDGTPLGYFRPDPEADT